MRFFPQLDLFLNLADEDLRDAEEDEKGGDGGGDDDLVTAGSLGDDDEGGEDGSESGRGGGATGGAEPQAVKLMRELVEAVEGNEAVSVEVELLADKLLALGGGGTGAGGGEGCRGPELWRRVR